MATTTNYGFEIPDNTDLVKDGAAAMRELGQDVDTQLFTALGGNYPGLRLVKKQTIGTGVSSVQVTGAFSSTYDNYKILVNGGTASGDNFGKFILGASTSGYFIGGGGATFAGATTFVATNGAAAANYTWYINTTWLNVDIDLKSPNLAKPTGISFNYVSGSAGYNGAGVHGTNDQHTSFTLSSFGAETLTGGTIYVYGYGAS
jgi:hypothetical protein